MGMIDWVEIRGTKITQLAKEAGLDIENHLQTKALNPVGTKYILTDSGILESRPVKERTGEMKSYKIADQIIEYAAMKEIGEKIRKTYLVGDIGISGTEKSTGKYEKWVARYKGTDSGDIELVTFFKGNAIQKLNNRGPWEERYYDLESPT